MDITKHLAEQEARWYTMSDTDVQIKIRLLKPKRMRQLKAKATRRGEFDDIRLGVLMLHECVVDWKNVKAEQNGSSEAVEIECDGANRTLLNDYWTEFSTFWQDIVLKHYDNFLELEEESEGN